MWLNQCGVGMGAGWRSPNYLRSHLTYWVDAEFVFSVLVRESQASAVGDDEQSLLLFHGALLRRVQAALLRAAAVTGVARVARCAR